MTHLEKMCESFFFRFVEIATAQYEPDENVKQQKMAQVMKEVIPFYLEKLESMA